MPKRDTVQPNVDLIARKVSDKSWSEASFSKMIGKHKRWLSEVRRGKNLPSPEEAARMCVLLQTTPEEILTEQADIDLVKGLLENDPGIKEARATEGEGLNGKIAQFIRSASAEELDEIYRYIDFLESKRAKK
jgi:hypothetical protein